MSICTQVGNVNAVACDGVAAVHGRMGIDAWLHVDEVFGLSARATTLHAGFVHGVTWPTLGDQCAQKGEPALR